MDRLFSLEGRTAFVTGASRGIGRAIALALAGAGAAVACAARALDQVAEAAAEIEAAGGRGRAIRLDVTSREQIIAAVRSAETTLGQIDILVNNAGVTLDKPSLEVTDEEWDTVLGTKYGALGLPRYAVYCASKAAVGGLTRSLAAEWARHGIQLNCLAAVYMNTDIPRAAMADVKTRERFLSKIPARRIGEPAEAAALAVYMASPASDFMTGQTVYLDGGQTTAW